MELFPHQDVNVKRLLPQKPFPGNKLLGVKKEAELQMSSFYKATAYHSTPLLMN